MTEIADIRFEPPIGFQTTGGPRWRTEIVPLSNGCEVRNRVWSAPLRRWQVSGVPVDEAGSEALIDFFNARAGAHQGFRFRDPFGWRSAHPITPEDTPLGLGDGGRRSFQLTRNIGGNTLQPVTRPVGASVRVSIDGMETGAFTVESETGVVTFDTAPSNGAVLTAGYEYDLPVRFEADGLELSQTSNGARQLVRLSLLDVCEVGT